MMICKFSWGLLGSVMFVDRVWAHAGEEHGVSLWDRLLPVLSREALFEFLGPLLAIMVIGLLISYFRDRRKQTKD